MSRTLITFVSMSGNTEDIATILKETLEGEGQNVSYVFMDEISIEDIKNYDNILIGSYTWGDGDLPYEAEDFYDELEKGTLQGQKIGCFGSGDRDYPQYCEAVNLFAERALEAGGDVFSEKLKIELYPETDEQILECQTFARNFLKWVEKGKVDSHVS